MEVIIHCVARLASDVAAIAQALRHRDHTSVERPIESVLHGNIARLALASITNGDVVYLDAIGVVVRRLRRDNPFVDARCYCECLDVGARFVWRGDGVVIERGDAFDRLQVGRVISGEVSHG